MPTVHEMYFEAMKPYHGQTLTTKLIGEILIEKFPNFNLGSNLPNDHSDVGNKNSCWCAGTNGRIFNRVNHGHYQIVKDTLAEDIREIEASDANETTKKTLIDARIGQGKFRQELIKHWQGCAVTGITLVSILKASHIKPWASCRDSEERLDKFNGLLLSPNLDTLFDRGFISFNNDGTILISPLISKHIDKLGITKYKAIKLLKQHYKYLEFHRNNVYKIN